MMKILELPKKINDKKVLTAAVNDYELYGGYRAGEFVNDNFEEYSSGSMIVYPDNSANVFGERSIFVDRNISVFFIGNFTFQ